MNDSRTSSMLQRVPVILAVTAASYGLQLPSATTGRVAAAGARSQATASQQVAARQPRAEGARRSHA